ncbi:MAG: homocysteine S-methyltransferase family protein [Planctomycetota bacterium]|jgi:homocysteine S-methyltransferase
MDEGSQILLLDGATGTELDRRGVDIGLPLWSARALLEAPEVLSEIHRDYLEAGAGAITTNTFRTHRRSLAKAGLGDRAAELTGLAVTIARRARDEFRPDALVLGSVAPLEDCYRPDLAPDDAACRTEHAEMIEHLVEAGADLILIETMNNLAEATAAADVAHRLAPGKWMISMCTRPQDPPGTLLSGEPTTPLLERLHDARAIGVNCVAAPHVEVQVRFLREALPDDARIMAYANVGHADEAGNWVITDAVDPEAYSAYARRWLEAGATIVGGCCGTTPGTIRAIGEVAGRSAAGGSADRRL